jgi:hypothetical protein
MYERDGKYYTESNFIKILEGVVEGDVYLEVP